MIVILFSLRCILVYYKKYSTMNNQFSTPYKNILSSGLKDRLKRCGRYHSSPSPTVTKSKCPQSEHLVNSTPTRPLSTVTNSHSLKNEQLTGTTPTRPVKRHFGGNNNALCSMSSPAKKICMDEDNTKCDVEASLLEDRTDISEFNTSLSSNPLNLLSPTFKSQKDSFATPVSKKSSLRRSKLNLQKTPVAKTIIPKIDSPAESSVNHLHKIKERLSTSVSEKEEMLRKLKMVKMYRKKNDLNKLEVLINKWRTVSQEAIQDLQNMLPEPKPSLPDLKQHLQIDEKLLKYNSENDDFD